MHRETTPELLARFAAGETSAYSVLVRRHETVLRRFVRSHLDPAFARLVSADDIVQETHVEALRSIGGFAYRSELSFLFWLCGIARNRIRTHARRLGRQPPLISLDAKDGGSSTGVDLATLLRAATRDPEASLDRERETTVLALALVQLPERRRQALVLRHVEGLEPSEAAAIMGMSAGAFRVLVSRALDDLAEAFESLRERS